MTENTFVCFGTKTTERAHAPDLPLDRKRTTEGRSQKQLAGQSSQENVIQEMRIGQKGDRSTEVRKVTAKTC